MPRRESERDRENLIVSLSVAFVFARVCVSVCKEEKRDEENRQDDDFISHLVGGSVAAEAAAAEVAMLES